MWHNLSSLAAREEKVGSHERLVQEAIGEIAQRIRKKTSKKNRKKNTALQEAALLYYETIRSLGRDVYDTDDEPVTGNTADIALFLRTIGVSEQTAGQLAPHVSAKIAHLALDGPD